MLESLLQEWACEDVACELGSDLKPYTQEYKEIIHTQFKPKSTFFPSLGKRERYLNIL